MNSRRIRQALAGAVLGAILAAYLFLFMPFTLYLGNSGEFTVSFGAISKVYWRLPVLLIGLVALVAMLLPRSRYLAYVSLLSATSLLFWIQGNLLVWDYGLFDGRGIDWDAAALRGWLEIVLWAGVLVAAAIGYRRLQLPLFRIAVFLCLLQAILLAYNWVQYAPQLSKPVDDANTSEAVDEIYRFSADENVVHIIADGFQSDIFAEFLEEGSTGKVLRSSLEGFTVFREHLGIFPYTHMTLPAILSGKIYRNLVPIQQHMESSVGGETILSVAGDAGYDVDLIVPPGAVGNIYRKGEYTNFYQVTNQHHVSSTDFATHDAARLLDLTLFRASPHFLKQHIYNDQLWLVQALMTDKKYMGLRFFSHLAFLNRFIERMTADRSVPVYKLIHLMLSHNPMVATAQCAYAGRVLPTVRENVKNQARCALVRLVALLEKMKKQGIYDEATIVLMGDHGAWVPPSAAKAIRNPDGITGSIINPAVMALSVPLMAIKRPGDTGPLKVSDAPSSIIDSAQTIAHAAGFEAHFPGESAFSLEEDKMRDRLFYYYPYKRSEWTDDYLSPIDEFSITGSGFDSASWHYNTTYHPGGEVRRSQSPSSVWVGVRFQ